MTAPGELNRRLALQEPVETPDGAGGFARSYAAVTTLWAKVEPVSARRSTEADAPGATVTHRITIRVGPEITTRHRFAEGARIYRIVSMREAVETRRFLIISAEERAD
jgi:SPP1 family predicted phage head-tail adaptor